MAKKSPLVINLQHFPAEGIMLEGDYPLKKLDIQEEERIRLPYNIEFKLHISPVDDAILVQGKLKSKLNCECDRCLEYFDQEISTDDVCHYYEHPEDGVIDLTNDVREDILLAFPQRCICSDKCQGLCIECGVNLNKQTCECSSDNNEESIWSSLDNLNLSGENSTDKNES